MELDSAPLPSLHSFPIHKEQHQNNIYNKGIGLDCRAPVCNSLVTIASPAPPACAAMLQGPVMLSPLHCPRPAHLASARAVQRPRKSALVVDDLAVNRLILGTILHKVGYIVRLSSAPRLGADANGPVTGCIGEGVPYLGFRRRLPAGAGSVA